MKYLYRLLFALMALPLAVACGDDDPTEGALPGTGGGGSEQPEGTALVLTITPTEIKANGIDTAYTKVMLGEEDVTEKATVKMNESLTDVRKFVTTKEGAYVFYAVYQGKVSQKITVTAVQDGNRIMEYRHRVLMVQHTGTWCAWCPRATMDIYTFTQTDADADDVVFIAAHSGDVFDNAYSSAITSTVGVTGFPAITVNLKNTQVTTTADLNQGAKYIRAATNTALRTEAHAGIEAQVSQPDASGNIAVTGNLYVNTSARYRIMAWLVEDNLYARQNNNYGGSFNQEFLNNHNNVVRAGSSSTPQGDFLVSGGQLLEGSHVPFNCTIRTAEAGIKDFNNCRVVVAATYSGNGGPFYVDNVIQCQLGGKVDLEKPVYE